MVSPSVSAPRTLPVTTPVLTSRGPKLGLPVGATFFGLMVTVIGTATVAPCPSLTVRVKVSVLSMAVAVVDAASCRAVPSACR
jgi:hypothetical protein